MTREETIETITRIMDDIRRVRDTTPSPAIEASARQIELQCHLALGYLGVAESVFPDASSLTNYLA